MNDSYVYIIRGDNGRRFEINSKNVPFFLVLCY